VSAARTSWPWRAGLKRNRVFPAPVFTGGNSGSITAHCWSLVSDGYRRVRRVIRPRLITSSTKSTLSSGPRSRFPLTNPVVRSRLRAPSAGRQSCHLRKPVRRVGVEPTTRWLGVA
jgi:hypothetical protein